MKWSLVGTYRDFLKHEHDPLNSPRVKDRRQAGAALVVAKVTASKQTKVSFFSSVKHKSHICQLKETDFFERGTKWSAVEPPEVMKVWKA